MKGFKYVVLAIVVSFCLLRLSIFIFRLPSYTIQASGTLYIVNKVSENIQVVNLSNGDLITEIPIAMQAFDAVTTADKKRLVLTNYGSGNADIIRIINVETNSIEKTIHSKGVTRTNGIAAFREGSKVGVVDLVQNTLMVLNSKTDSIEKSIPTQQKKSHLLVLHPTKFIAYVTNIDSGSVSVIDLNSEEVVKLIPCGEGRKAIEINPDGSEVWVTNTNENSITVINTNTNEITNTLETGNNPLRLKFSIDGKYCLVANALAGTIFVYNQQSKKKVKTIYLHGKTTFIERILYSTPRPVNLFMHPNGLYTFVTNSNARKIEVLDMKTFTIVSTIGTGKMPDALAFIE